MDIIPALFAGAITALLVGLGVYYGHHQLKTLRSLPTQEDLPLEDRGYIRNQARLRLICCVFMILIALLVTGSYVLGLEQQATDLGEWRAAEQAAGRTPELNAEQLQFRKVYTWYWIVVVLLVFAIFLLASCDLWIIRRYGRRKMRQIREDRRAMVADEVARLRIQRNGH